jgi:hypothetical protein
MSFDYKKYSFENLEKWVEDAINSSEASPQEIYDVIKSVVLDNYYTYKNRTEHCYELLALLNGNGKGHIPAYDEYVKEKENLVCDKEDKSLECKKAWASFWEENYYPEEHKKFTEDIQDDGMRPWGHSDLEYQPRKLSTYDEMVSWGYEMTADGFWIKETEETETSSASVSSKQNRWVLPVQQKIEEGIDDYFIQLPDDLLEQVNWKENDQLIWIDRKDGTFELRKV